MNKEKTVSAVISAVIIAGAGGYAYATQAAPRQTSPNTSTAVCSSAISASSTQSSAAPQESSEAVSKVPAPVITPPKSIASRPGSRASNAPSSSQQTTSLIPGKEYFDIVDPVTGRYIGPREQKYFTLKKQLGGDAGEVPPDKSTACAPIIKEWNQKEIRK